MLDQIMIGIGRLIVGNALQAVEQVPSADLYEAVDADIADISAVAIMAIAYVAMLLNVLTARAHQPPTAGGAFMCSSSDMAVRKADRDNRAARMEAEANRFSANMLMPLTRFRPDMEALGSPDLESIFALATRYDMSREATSIHYTTHHGETCAIVLSKDGIVRRIYRPSRFPFIDAPTNRPLPPPSCAARFSSSGSGWGELDGGVWLGGWHGAGRSLREQVHRASGGWTYSLLVLEEEGRDSSEDSQESDLEDVFDRFSRRGDSDR